MDDQTIYVRQVPEELVRRAKSASALKGQTLREFVIEAVRAAVDADGKKPAKK